MLCPICQSLIFYRVSTTAIMLPRCMEGEGVTQPMCHTTQVRRQGGVVQIVTQRGCHPGWHTEGGVTKGCHQGVSQRISPRVSHRGRQQSVQDVIKTFSALAPSTITHAYTSRHLYHTCCLSKLSLSPCVDATDTFTAAQMWWKVSTTVAGVRLNQTEKNVQH